MQVINGRYSSAAQLTGKVVSVRNVFLSLMIFLFLCVFLWSYVYFCRRPERLNEWKTSGSRKTNKNNDIN